MQEQSNTSARSQTVGEWRVRTHFNPNNVSKVDQLKALAAQMIDLVLDGTCPDTQLAEHAAREIEGAAMWGVKAVTAPK